MLIHAADPADALDADDPNDAGYADAAGDAGDADDAISDYRAVPCCRPTVPSNSFTAWPFPPAVPCS